MNKPFEMLLNAIEGYKFVVRLPVQFRDVDMRGHLNNVAYLSYLETVRLEYFIEVMQIEQLVPYEEALPIVMGGQSINYRSPAYYREQLLIGVRTAWVKRSSFGFDFEMREEASGRLVTDGNYVHVMYNSETHRSKPVPDNWLTRLEVFEGRKLRPE